MGGRSLVTAVGINPISPQNIVGCRTAKLRYHPCLLCCINAGRISLLTDHLVRLKIKTINASSFTNSLVSRPSRKSAHVASSGHFALGRAILQSSHCGRIMPALNTPHWTQCVFSVML
jgi:hypothetical protein